MKHLLTLLLVLGITAASRAGEDHDHGHSHADIKVPATLPEVRTGIAAEQKKLSKALGAKDAKAAHAATDVLAAYVRAIPGMLTAADDTTKQRVTGMANNAAKAWGQAAHDADHGDYEKAQREAAKAGAAYQLLEDALAEGLRGATKALFHSPEVYGLERFLTPVGPAGPAGRCLGSREWCGRLGQPSLPRRAKRLIALGLWYDDALAGKDADVAAPFPSPRLPARGANRSPPRRTEIDRRGDQLIQLGEASGPYRGDRRACCDPRTQGPRRREAR